MSNRKRSRVPLAIAMGAGLTAAAVGVGLAAARRSAGRHRSLPDERASDVDAFDLDALGVTHHRIPSHDGGDLHIVEKGPADGPPLLLLHGITLQARIWGYQLRDLSDRWRVLAVDLRGHGESKAGTEGFGLDRLARDLRTVLETLDLRDVIVVGHSMGGMTLMQFCAEHRDVLDDRVAGCVFLASAPVVPLPPAVQRMLQRMAPGVARFGDRGGWERFDARWVTGRDLTYVLARRAFGRHASPLHVQLTADLAASVPPSTMVPSGIGLLEHDAEQALAQTHTPSMVIGGELDNLTPIALSRRIAEHLPDSELHVLADAGHQLMLERPAELADLLESFRKRAERGVITAVPGVRVGHWTDSTGRTGCTVVLLPEGTVASGEVRGGAPASRELALLEPHRTVARLDAVVLAGGSAFGLAAADGVMAWCAARGVGYPTRAGSVPIVVGLALFDLVEAEGAERPGPAAGEAACVAATAGEFPRGRVGAGAGCTVAKWRGREHARPGGLGGATVEHDGLVVAALVAVNAVGDLRVEGEVRVPLPPEEAFAENTTIGVIATNARLDKAGCLNAAQAGHDGLARALDPAHTAGDGDALVVAATGTVDADPSVVRQLAAVAVEQAVRDALS